jgi:TPR repeat protein
VEQAAKDQLQIKLDEQVKARYPDGGVQRVVLLQHGDDPAVEPGELLVRVFIKVAGGPGDPAQALDTWEQANKTMLDELQRELAEARLPGARLLEFILDDGNDSKPTIRLRIGGPLSDLDKREPDLTPVMARLGPVDLWTLDMLITAGIAASRAEAIRWALARIRERPAYAKLSERTRELDELKTQF